MPSVVEKSQGSPSLDGRNLEQAPDDYGPTKATTRNRDTDQETDKNPPVTSNESNILSPPSTIRHIKPFKGRHLPGEQDNQLLFFDDWGIEDGTCKNEVNRKLEYFYHCTDTNDYDPVDHVTLLLGNCALLDELSSRYKEDQGSETPSKPIESVWLKRRRAADIVERRLPSDCFWTKDEAVDNDGFIVTGEVGNSVENATTEETKQNWISF